jgi:RimJ/RimL family protein N-acetyltransferase
VVDAGLWSICDLREGRHAADRTRRLVLDRDAEGRRDQLHVRSEVWGRAYATESATEFLNIGFGQRNLQRMVATTNPANAASARVLRKVGMTSTGRKDLGSVRLVDLHEISRGTWETLGRRANTRRT